MGGFEGDEQMNVIGHTSDTLRNGIQASSAAAEVFVEAVAPGRGDRWFTMLGREDDVI